MSSITDMELESMFNHWLDHYTMNGDSHYNDTPDWRIREIYWDRIVGRVLEDIGTEMTDVEIEQLCNRLTDL